MLTLNSWKSYRVFVEKVKNHSRQPIVVPMPVDKKKSLQVLEPWNGKIGGHHGLHTLHSGYAHTDVSSLNMKRGSEKSLQFSTVKLGYNEHSVEHSVTTSNWL